jgi:RNA polymerase sigma-70 factor (ECF subfamily)
MNNDTVMEIYQETIRPLYAYVSQRCGGDRSLAEDVTQETWLRAVAHWRRKGLPDVPLAWLKTVAKNLLLNSYRRARPVPLDSLPPQLEPSFIDNGFEIDSPATAALVNWGLARLSREQAELIEQFHLEGRKMSEIATERKLSERAVEGRLHRARKKLRHHVEYALRTGGVRP